MLLWVCSVGIFEGGGRVPHAGAWVLEEADTCPPRPVLQTQSIRNSPAPDMQQPALTWGSLPAASAHAGGALSPVGTVSSASILGPQRQVPRVQGLSELSFLGSPELAEAQMEPQPLEPPEALKGGARFMV